MNALTQYDFGGHRLRVVLDLHGNPWFPASDACRVLGMDYEKRGTGIYVEHIAERNKRGLSSIEGLTPSNELPPHTTMLSEAGLYQLIMKSRKPEAQKFQEWVTEEVLPSIRKTGSYVHKKSVPEPVLMGQARELSEAALEERVAAAIEKQFSKKLVPALNQFRDDMNEAMGKFAPRRREVPISVRETHRLFTASRNFRCPCCDEVKTSWSDFNVDHYKDRQDPSTAATWGICAVCNQELKDAKSHKSAEPAFLAYQRWLEAWGLRSRTIKSCEVQADLF